MGEKVTSDFRLRKCAKEGQQLQPVDRISQLPNEILAYILSFLTLEDAARTSVLSKHWMHTWMSVSTLNFDSAKMWQGIEGIDEMVKYKILRSKRLKYVQWVNKVLLSHKSVVLDAFRIRFDLGKSSQNDIDRWLQYAFARRVQRLDLNLLKYGDLTYDEANAYTFPHRLLDLSNGNSSSCGNGINSDASFGFKSLRVLTFNNVNVSGKVLQFFLHNCPFLEYLVVESSEHLKQFEVCGPFLAPLKHLEIIYCPVLRSLTVRDTNIVSLKVTEGHTLVLKNVSMLVDVFITGRFYENFIGNAISWLSCCLSKLEVLTLQITDFQVEQERAEDVALPQLTKLKQLTFVVLASQDDSLIVFTSLIRASPNLEKFVLKLEWLDDIARKRTESKKGLAFPLRRLKVVELCGYYGRTTEVELLEYFIQNAVALERIIVGPCDRSCYCPFLHKPEPEEEGMARNLAKQQLEELVPPHIEWVLL